MIPFVRHNDSRRAYSNNSESDVCEFCPRAIAGKLVLRVNNGAGVLPGPVATWPCPQTLLCPENFYYNLQ